MANVSFGNLNTQAYSPELKKRAESEENFGAIDKDQLKQDAVELSNKAKENAKENVIFRTLRNFGVQEPKKTLISIGLTAVTIIVGATIGNKSVKKMTEAGLKVDDILKNGKLKNVHGKISNFFKKIGGNVKDFFMKSKTIKDISDTLKTRRLKPKAQMAKGMGQGFATQFAFTNSDVVLASALKQQGEIFGKLKKLTRGKKQAINVIIESVREPDKAKAILEQVMGDKKAAEDLFNKIIKNNDNYKKAIGQLVGDSNADKYFKQFIGVESIDDAIKFSDELTDDIAKHFYGSGYTKANLKEVLFALKDGKVTKINGKDFNPSAFTNIDMNREGFIGGWWPANIIDKIGKKIKGDKFNFARGNLGDSLLKYNMAKGNMADTMLGKLTQKSVLIPTESVTNFVCDFAGMNLILTSMLYNLYNTAQDAPKGQKTATIADDFVGSIGSLAISTPMAFATTYGLASLKNLEGTTLSSKLLKQAGKVFGMGLGKGHHNVLARFGGGALRFGLSMFVFSGLFAKPMYSIIHKIFGKPYDEAEATKQKQIEEAKKQVIPELGITQGEFLEKMQKNPQALQVLQQNPQLAPIIDKNPKLLLDLLDGKDITESVKNNPAPVKKPSELISPINRELFGKSKQQVKTEQKNPVSKDTATYIPSSDFVASNSSLSPEEQNKINNIMAEADKALQRAEKFI